jgi:signal transduction histidine kinase/ligand-binding sensor protein
MEAIASVNKNNHYISSISGNLTEEELTSIFPEEHLTTLAIGHTAKNGIPCGILLKDKPDVFAFWEYLDDNPKYVRSRWCVHLRKELANCRVCQECDAFACKVAEEKARDQSWQGFAYLCKGGLIDFVVPIRMRRTKQFIGVAFHGQFRPYCKDKQETEIWLKNYRWSIANNIGLQAEVEQFDALSMHTESDIQKFTTIIKEKCSALTGEISESQALLLAIPIEEMVGYYLTAPMIHIKKDTIFRNLPRTQYYWDQKNVDYYKMLNDADLNHVELNNLFEFNSKENSIEAINLPVTLQKSCESLAKLVATIAEPHVNIRIEKKTLNDILENLIIMKDMDAFWARLNLICERIASWLSPAEIVLLRRFIPESHAINESETMSFSEIYRHSTGSQHFMIKKNVWISLNNSQVLRFEAPNAPELSKEDMQVLATILPNEPFILGRSIPLFSGPKNNRIIHGFIFLFLLRHKTPFWKEVFDYVGILEEIRHNFEVTLSRLQAVHDLQESIEAHKKALLSITHSVHRPFVDIISGATLVRSFINKDPLVNKWLTNIIHSANDGQIIANSTAKVFASLLKRNKIAFRKDHIDVSVELRSLCNRMRLFEQSDNKKDDRDKEEEKKRPNKNKLNIVYEQEIPKIMAVIDRQTFLYVMYNLLDNAIKYADPGTTVFVQFGLEGEDGSLCLKVKNYGKPIPIKKGEEDLPFQLFWRGQDQIKSSDMENYLYPGLGVGLWACRQLLSLQNSKIWLIPRDWDNPQFTIFAVQFPCYVKR